MGDIEFKGVGRGVLRRVRLAGFTELGKTGMDEIELVRRIGCWDHQISPASF